MQDSFLPFPPGHLGGMIAVNVVAVLANLALLPVILRVAWLAVRRPWVNAQSEPSEYVFFHTQLGQYVSSFIVAMLFNTIAGILGVPWTFMRGIKDGPLCRAQAFFISIGSISGGFFTIAIAVHALGALVLQRRQSSVICRFVTIFGWGSSVAIAIIPFFLHLSQSVYGPSDFFCGIRSSFPTLLFFFHLLPILLASLISIILYSLVFFALRGTIKVRSGIRVTLDPAKRWAEWEQAEIYHQFVVKLARSMLWYPVAYIVFLVPYAMVRLFTISGYRVPFGAMVFAYVCWYLLNVVEVPLLYSTFRLLGWAFDDVRREGDSFFSNEKPEEAIQDRRESLSPPPPPKPLPSVPPDRSEMSSYSNQSSFESIVRPFSTSIAKLAYREDPTSLPVIASFSSLSDLTLSRDSPFPMVNSLTPEPRPPPRALYSSTTPPSRMR